MIFCTPGRSVPGADNHWGTTQCPEAEDIWQAVKVHLEFPKTLALPKRKALGSRSPSPPPSKKTGFDQSPKLVFWVKVPLNELGMGRTELEWGEESLWTISVGPKCNRKPRSVWCSCSSINARLHVGGGGGGLYSKPGCRYRIFGRNLYLWYEVPKYLGETDVVPRNLKDQICVAMWKGMFRVLN